MRAIEDRQPWCSRIARESTREAVETRPADEDTRKLERGSQPGKALAQGTVDQAIRSVAA